MLTWAANLGRGFRTPSFYNMYVYGYHGGVFAYQIGNPDLENETSLDISSSLRFRSQSVGSLDEITAPIFRACQRSSLQDIRELDSFAVSVSQHRTH